MMIKNNIASLIFSITILTFVWSCNDENACNDCLEVTTKSLRYVDSEGINLLFGNQAIYNPENLVITDSNGEFVDVWLQEDNGTIAFDLEVNATSYQIVLTDTFTDNVQFELAERKSESCCGNVTFSTNTILNGQEIENSDLIVITN